MFPLFRIVSANFALTGCVLACEGVKITLAFNKTELLVVDFLMPITKECGVEIWDVEFKKEGPNYVLRVFIDKPDGISIEDCERVSRALEKVLDEKDPIPQAYLLEVSSAGLDRVIKYPEHFQKCMGKNVDVKLFAPVEVGKEFTAKLFGYDGKTVTFQIDGEELAIPLEKISSIRQSIEF